MTEGRHTAEPWSVFGREGYGANGWLVFQDANDADAHRIVACVNACAGMPDSALNGANLRRQLDHHHDEIVRLTRQRDQLLAALKDLREQIDNCDGIAQLTTSIADQAIAMVGG